MQEVIGSALHHLDRRFAAAQVDDDVAADLPLVHIDAVAIEQVLVNLLDNAVEYTPPRHGHRNHRRAPTTTRSTVEVADRRARACRRGRRSACSRSSSVRRPAGSRARDRPGAGDLPGASSKRTAAQIAAANRTGRRGASSFRFTLPPAGTAAHWSMRRGRPE